MPSICCKISAATNKHLSIYILSIMKSFTRFSVLLIAIYLLQYSDAHAQLTAWPVRIETGDYDEQVIHGYPTCYQYAMQYTGTWRGYIECLPGDPQCYAGFAVNTLQNLGNICYRSRVDAAAQLRGGYGWFGGNAQQQIMFCRRNYQVSFQNQPIDPVGFELYFNKAEVDALINDFNTLYGTNKTLSDVAIFRYSGPNQDLDPANNSAVQGNYERIPAQFVIYGNNDEYLYAEFNTTGYSEFYLGITASQLYVNDNSQAGDVYTTATGDDSHAGSSSAPFATIAHAVSVAQPGDIIYADAGTYVENVVIDKPLSLKGAHAGTNPGTSLDRGGETVVYTASNDITNAVVFAINSTNISIDGFTIDGDNPSLAGGLLLNGADVNAGFGLFNQQQLVDGLRLKNNIIRNFNRYAMLLQRQGQPTVTENNIISENHIDNIGNRGLGFFTNAYGDVTNNYMSRVVNGIFFANATTFASQPIVLTNNIIESNVTGIHLQSTFSPSLAISGNTISTIGSIKGNGIYMGLVTVSNAIDIVSNQVSGKQNGVFVQSVTAPSGVHISGAVSACGGVGLFLVDDDVNFYVSNMLLTNNDVGIDASSGGVMPLSFANTSISGGTTGIRFYGSGLSLPGDALTGVSFAGQSKEYILQTVNSFDGQVIDASDVVFEGLKPVTMSQAQLFATEDKLMHKIDFDDVGYFKLLPNKVFVTPNSFAADLPPVFGTPTTEPDINRAVGAAAEGDTIYIAAGAYTNQVTLDKGLSLFGEGQSTTSIHVPEITAAPPGDFFEQSVIQTTFGISDVHLRDLTVEGAFYRGITPVILQTGGTVIDCALVGGNQGIYFRTRDEVKATLVQGCTVSAEYVGVNFQGTAQTATLTNNDIVVANQGFSAGVFGLGPLVDLTATGNHISGYATHGFMVDRATITQNSIVSNNGKAITAYGEVMATCNWFGVNDITEILPKLSGNITYAPWLSNGTDNDMVAVGFQPAEGTCTGRQNKFYVNDNNQDGDIFTTAVGNNANIGTPAAPLLTIDAAINRAQDGDSIFVDAGQHISPYMFINKSLTIIGTNADISPNDPGDPLLPNASRNAEAIIDGGNFTILANDIVLKGLTFAPGDRQAILLSNNEFGNFIASYNKFDISTSNYSAVEISGTPIPAPELPTTSGFTFSDNRFEKYDGGTAYTLSFNNVTDVSVEHNSFVLAGTTVNRYRPVLAGGSGLVNNFNFAYNTVDRSGFAVSAQRLIEGSILHNKFLDCTRPLWIASSIANGTSIDFSHNEVISTSGGVGSVFYGRLGNGLPNTSNVFRVNNNIISGVSIAGQNSNAWSAMTISVNNTVVDPVLEITGNKITYSGDFSDAVNEYIKPITLRGNMANLLISQNELIMNNSGAYPPYSPASGLPENAAITFYPDFSTSAYMPQDATIDILHNKIQGFRQSIIFYDLNGGGFNSIPGYGSIPTGATVNIQENSFMDDFISINNGESSEIINASCNWYGSAALQNINEKVTISTVNFSPWLTNGTDSDPAAVGFQPQNGVCSGTPVILTLVNAADVSCFGANDGTADVTVSGGVLPYTYAWTKNEDAPYQAATEDIINLSPGVYTLSVIDASGTTASLTVSISEPPVIVATATGTSTSCVNTASVEASGGVGNFTYLWSNGANTATISSIPAGSYTATVSDETGCTATATVDVTGNQAFNPSVSVSDVLCFGTATGSLTVTNANGVAPFTYSLNGIDFQAGNVFDNLAAGSYTVTVKDALGCTGFNTKTIAEPAALLATLENVQNTCGGQSTGSIVVSVSGGSPAYTYAWTGPDNFISNQQSISNLPVGNYTLTVTDKNGCVAVLNASVGAFPAIIVLPNVSNILCKGETNGAIVNTISGGTGSGFSYLWNTGAATKDISGLGTGNYNLTVTDLGSGCTISQAYTINQPASAVKISTAKSNVAGCNSPGMITATGSGGTSPYQYSIDGVQYSGNNAFGGLMAGDYTVYVKDANGCISSAVVSITDNGTDEYEGNNSKKKASTITIGSVINARIAIATDVADWFTFTTPSGSNNYTVTLNHPSASFAVSLYPSANNAAALVPVSTTGSTKTYSLAGNTTYYLEVTGGLSYSCYALSVSSVSLITHSGGTPVKIKPSVSENDGNEGFDVLVFGNPTTTEFKLQVKSNKTDKMKLSIFDATGRLLEVRENVVPYQVISVGKRLVGGMYLAEFVQGDKRKTVRLIKQ